MLIDDYYLLWVNKYGSQVATNLSTSAGDNLGQLWVRDSAGRNLIVPSKYDGAVADNTINFYGVYGHVKHIANESIYFNVHMGFDGETVTTAVGGLQTVYLYAATLSGPETINQPVYVYYEWYTNDALWGAMYWHSAHIYTINADSQGASGGVLWWGQVYNYSGDLGRIHISWRWQGVQHDQYINFPYGTASQTGQLYVAGNRL